MLDNLPVCLLFTTGLSSACKLDDFLQPVSQGEEGEEEEEEEEEKEWCIYEKKPVLKVKRLFLEYVESTSKWISETPIWKGPRLNAHGFKELQIGPASWIYGHRGAHLNSIYCWPSRYGYTLCDGVRVWVPRVLQPRHSPGLLSFHLFKCDL